MNRLFLAAALAASCIGLPAQAATIVVGDGKVGISMPFGGNGTGARDRYQQVYSSKVFAAPILIQSVSFERISGGTTPAGGTVTLSVSTTNAAVDALSTNFAANIGANNSTVFSGTLRPILVGNILKFTFSNPFRYVPTSGNLLLDFKFANYAFPGSSVQFRANGGDAGGVYSRMQNFDNSNNIGTGLVTTFETSAIGAVPEPATWAMLILGFGVIGGAMRSARRQSVRVTYA
jgi:PEP-CTERM motif